MLTPGRRNASEIAPDTDVTAIRFVARSTTCAPPTGSPVASSNTPSRRTTGSGGVLEVTWALAPMRGIATATAAATIRLRSAAIVPPNPVLADDPTLRSAQGCGVSISRPLRYRKAHRTFTALLDPSNLLVCPL